MRPSLKPSIGRPLDLLSAGGGALAARVPGGRRAGFLCLVVCTTPRVGDVVVLGEDVRVLEDAVVVLGCLVMSVDGHEDRCQASGLMRLWYSLGV